LASGRRAGKRGRCRSGATRPRSESHGERYRLARRNGHREREATDRKLASVGAYQADRKCRYACPGGLGLFATGPDQDTPDVTGINIQYAATCRKPQMVPGAALDAGLTGSNRHKVRRTLNSLKGALPFGNAAGPVLATLLFRAGVYVFAHFPQSQWARLIPRLVSIGYGTIRH
jgi:hypothetical protein